MSDRIGMSSAHDRKTDMTGISLSVRQSCQSVRNAPSIFLMIAPFDTSGSFRNLPAAAAMGVVASAAVAALPLVDGDLERPPTKHRHVRSNSKRQSTHAARPSAAAAATAASPTRPLATRTKSSSSAAAPQDTVGTTVAAAASNGVATAAAAAVARHQHSRQSNATAISTEE